MTTNSALTPSRAISIQGLYKSYGKVQALSGVDLEVNRGEIFGFLGPNGAGKTTTIRCLLDLIRPNAGRLSVLGLNPQEASRQVRARVGYLPGELHLDDNLTAGQALRWFDAFRGGGADWKQVETLVQRMQLNVNTSIKNFSKGNKQKVGIIQAFMHQPELLLLDEPTSGLDPLMQQVVVQLVQEAAGRGATVFFSSHILSEVQEIAGRVAIVRKGRIVDLAATADLQQRSLLQVKVRFLEKVDAAHFTALDGVRLRHQEDAFLILEVAGKMDALIKKLAQFPVSSLETERPGLEDVFLAHYANKEERR